MSKAWIRPSEPELKMPELFNAPMASMIMHVSIVFAPAFDLKSHVCRGDFRSNSTRAGIKEDRHGR